VAYWWAVSEDPDREDHGPLVTDCKAAAVKAAGTLCEREVERALSQAAHLLHALVQEEFTHYKG
jgi:hypothetical protein